MHRPIKPWYQKAAEVIGFAVAAFVAFGAILDAVTNAAIITPGVTYAGTLLIVGGGLALHALLRHRRLRIVVSGGIQGHISGLRRYHIATCAGVIVLLWVPRLFSPLSQTVTGSTESERNAAAQASGFKVDILTLDSAVVSLRRDSVQLHRLTVSLMAGKPMRTLMFPKERYPIELALAWKVTFTNTSSHAVSIVDHQVLNAIYVQLPDDGKEFVTEITGELSTTVATQARETAYFPINLDPGESESYVIKAHLPLNSIAYEMLRGRIAIGAPITKSSLFRELRTAYYRFPFDAVPSTGHHGSRIIPISDLPPNASVARWVQRERYWTVIDVPKGDRPYIQFIFKSGSGRITRQQVPLSFAAESVKRWYLGDADEEAN